MADLLADFLVQSRFIFNVKLLRSVGSEKENFRLLRNAKIFLVEDRPAKGEAFQICRVAVGITQSEDPISLRQRPIDQIRPDKHFFRQLNNLEMPILKHEQKLVEFRA